MGSERGCVVFRWPNDSGQLHQLLPKSRFLAHSFLYILLLLYEETFTMLLGLVRFFFPCAQYHEKIDFLLILGCETVGNLKGGCLAQRRRHLFVIDVG